jgi:methionine synthase II (cobalamin-independent)
LWLLVLLPVRVHIDFLRGRIEDASQHIALENLGISLQCGFSSTEEGNRLTEEDHWNKLNLVIDTAKSVWKDWFLTINIF